MALSVEKLLGLILVISLVAVAWSPRCPRARSFTLGTVHSVNLDVLDRADG
jgi:hypothetical protein